MVYNILKRNRIKRGYGFNDKSPPSICNDWLTGLSSSPFVVARLVLIVVTSKKTIPRSCKPIYLFLSLSHSSTRVYNFSPFRHRAREKVVQSFEKSILPTKIYKIEECFQTTRITLYYIYKSRKLNDVNSLIWASCDAFIYVCQRVRLVSFPPLFFTFLSLSLYPRSSFLYIVTCFCKYCT